METKRKCGQCKEYLILEKQEFVIYKETYYHPDCLVTQLTEKKRRGISREEAVELVESLKVESKEKVKDIITKGYFYSWLQRAYDIVVIPRYFFQKMESVYSGEYKGLKEGIPVEDILFIWKKKKEEFDRTNEYYKRIGKIIDGPNRLNYDLAIVLSKYDSYKKWKEQQRITQQQTQELVNTIKINYNSIDKNVMNNIKKENDLSSYLEEI